MWQTTIAALLTLSVGTTAPIDPRPAIPEPTGHLAVGTIALHLVDHERPDPWDPAKPYRELMVSIWYPARPGGGPATYLEPAAAKDTAPALGLPAGSTALGEVRVPATANAQARGGAHPVVLSSPGHLAYRAINTTLVTDLASHGYVVVTIDHTHGSIVDFPGGRVAPRLVRVPDSESPEFPQQIVEFNRDTIAARVADTDTVLDALTRLAGGANPDAERRHLPPAGSATRSTCRGSACSATPPAGPQPPKRCTPTTVSTPAPWWTATSATTWPARCCRRSCGTGSTDRSCSCPASRRTRRTSASRRSRRSGPTSAVGNRTCNSPGRTMSP